MPCTWHVLGMYCNVLETAEFKPHTVAQTPLRKQTQQHALIRSSQCPCVSCCCCCCCQGLGTAVLAAIMGALPKTGGSIADHTVLLSGTAQQ
jgi:hypothetical protein